MTTAEKIKTIVDKRFDNFGVNKRHEVARLIFEISKREKVEPSKIFEGLPPSLNQFDRLKDYLVKRRFPTLAGEGEKVKYVYSHLEVDPNLKVDINDNQYARDKIIPRNFYIEEAVAGSLFVKRLKNKFPQAKFVEMSAYRDFAKTDSYGIADYNKRLEKFFIVKEEFDFFKKCPCSNKSVTCGYHVINLGSGCAFECTYCYLQDYINYPGIVLPANVEDFFDAFKFYKQDIKLGSGELTDSLIFDHITEYSPAIVNFFKDYPKSTFEFKTKSNNIDLLLTVKPAGNILVSWSISPQAIIDSTEYYTASLSERLEAAVRCVDAGYKAAFHLDPVIYYKDWEKDYAHLINQIFDRINEQDIAWISIGTLRMTPRLKKIIENRFPENTLLDEEFSLSYDGKLRYSPQVRTDIYTKIIEGIKKRAPDVYLYLCMEEKSVCGDCNAAPLKNPSSGT